MRVRITIQIFKSPNEPFSTPQQFNGHQQPLHPNAFNSSFHPSCSTVHGDPHFQHQFDEQSVQQPVFVPHYQQHSMSNVPYHAQQQFVQHPHFSNVQQHHAQYFQSPIQPQQPQQRAQNESAATLMLSASLDAIADQLASIKEENSALKATVAELQAVPPPTKTASSASLISLAVQEPGQHRTTLARLRHLNRVSASHVPCSS